MTDIKIQIDEILAKGLPKHLEYQTLLRDLINLIDLTTLEGSDNEEVVKALCTKAQSFENKFKDCKNVAAVCVYPTMIQYARKHLSGKNISVASVAGAFPAGQSPIEIKVAEVDYAIKQGADEIDMVISRGKFLQGNFAEVVAEIKSIKQACKDKHLKVILETGELKSLENIKKASELAIASGADFIKTSTGKIAVGATLEAMFIMLNAIKEHYLKTGIKIGIKPAGGISDIDTAIKYYTLVYHILGSEWLNNKLFRIGASRLVDRILEEMK